MVVQHPKEYSVKLRGTGLVCKPRQIILYARHRSLFKIAEVDLIMEIPWRKNTVKTVKVLMVKVSMVSQNIQLICQKLATSGPTRVFLVSKFVGEEGVLENTGPVKERARKVFTVMH